jgi:hypothetical protein
VELVDVESSNVRAIGYNPEVKLLRIVYRDGVVYDHEDITAEFHAALMAAPSKGKFIARHLKGGVKHDPIRLRELALTPSALSTFESDPCCDPPLTKAMRDGKLADVDTWTCPKCGCTWTAQLIGGIKHWSPVPLIEVLRV